MIVTLIIFGALIAVVALIGWRVWLAVGGLTDDIDRDGGRS